MTRARDVANLIGSGNYSSTTFTATAGQTAFTISHTQGFIQVFMNGLLLDETVDYTSNGSAVTLTSGAAAGDEIEVVAYNTFSVGDALNQAAADTRYVNTTGDTMTGNLTVSGGAINVTGTSTATNTEADIGLYHTFKNLSSDINTGVALTMGSNNSGSATIYAQRTGANNEHKMGFQTRDSSGSAYTRMAIDGSGRVTMPYQPMATAGSTMGGAGSNRHPATTIYTQKGGTNLAANGRFTCPVAGVYRATLSGYTNYTNSYGYIYLKKNGSQHGYNHHFNHAAGTMHSIVAMSQLVTCSASDYLEFWGGAGNGYVHYSNITFELVG